MISIKQHIRAITLLGIPLIVGQLGATVQQFVDTAMVGAYGTLELSAAGFVCNVFNLVIFFLLGISYSTTPVVGACFGRQDFLGAAKALRESLITGVTVSLLLVVALLVLNVNIEILGQPEEIIPLAKPYFLTMILSLPFLAVFNSLKQFSDALGQTQLPMWVMLWANVLNILLNWMLIFGVEVSGNTLLEPLGLLGAGIATLSARVFMALAMVLLVYRRESYSACRGDFNALLLLARKDVLDEEQREIVLSGKARKCSMPDREGLWRMTRIGIPISLQMCLEAASFNVCAIFMGWIGSKEIAAHQIMCTISTLNFLVMYGIGAAAAVRVSQFRGREEWMEVRRTAYVAFGMGVCWFLVISTVICLGIYPLTALFTHDVEVTAIVVSLLVPFVAYQVGDCMQIMFANVLRGIECVKIMMGAAFVAYILVSIPLSYFFAFEMGWGAVGVWCGMPFGLTLAGALFFWEFNRQTRMRIRQLNR